MKRIIYTDYNVIPGPLFRFLDSLGPLKRGGKSYIINPMLGTLTFKRDLDATAFKLRFKKTNDGI